MCSKLFCILFRQEMLRNAEGFFQLGGFPGVVGAVDGTHIGLKPPGDEARVYMNRKGNYSINVQVIINKYLLLYKQILKHYFH